MTENFQESFTRVLLGDVRAAEERMRENDTQMHRRDLVRAAFAAIEGLHWRLKQNVLRQGKPKLSPFEYAAMIEQSYSVDERGNVSTFPRFLPLPPAIRLVVNAMQRYRPEYKVDFNHAGWSNLKEAIEIRNRLVHPKRLEDLTVSEEEINKTLSGLMWFLALVVEILREINKDLREEYFARTGKEWPPLSEASE
jgi:hypothetical protein